MCLITPLKEKKRIFKLILLRITYTYRYISLAIIGQLILIRKLQFKMNALFLIQVIIDLYGEDERKIM